MDMYSLNHSSFCLVRLVFLRKSSERDLNRLVLLQWF